MDSLETMFNRMASTAIDLQNAERGGNERIIQATKKRLQKFEREFNEACQAYRHNGPFPGNCPRYAGEYDTVGSCYSDADTGL